MTANCLGNFGTYQYLWSRHAHDHRVNKDPNLSNETVWITKRYIPSDLRVTAPVPRHKLLTPNIKPKPQDQWLPPGLRSRTARSCQGAAVYVSQPSTQSEEWSTLRQMLPSSGRAIRIRPENWGTGSVSPPVLSADVQRKFPHINSPMTRYVDDMHLTNRLFYLH